MLGPILTAGSVDKAFLSRSILFVIVCALALAVPAVLGAAEPTPASAAQGVAETASPPAPERPHGPFGPELVGPLVRLNDRLDLDTFPEDSPFWAVRLIAAIEHRIERREGAQKAAPSVPGRELLQRLAADLKGLLADQAQAGEAGGSPGLAGRNRARLLKRIHETVRLLHDKLDRLDQEQSRTNTIRALVAPTNDACAAATVIGLGTVSGTTVDATIDGSSSCDAPNNRRDVWYRYTPTVDRVVTFGLSGSFIDATLSLHTGCPAESGTEELTCSDSAGGTLEPVVWASLAAGEDVWIRVSAYSGTVGAFDLTLEPSRGVTGTVTRSETGAPVAGAGVEVFDQFGDYVDETVTGADGSYAVGGLDEGDYYVQVGKAGLISQLYDGISCPFWQTCYPGYSGDLVHVGASGLTPGIDFSLEAAGGLSGTVTDAATDQGLVAYVTLYGSTGEHLETYVTGSDGTFGIDDLPPGTYFVATESMGYLMELYDDIPCPDGCDPTTGTGIAVVGETTTSGIDFALSPLGTVTGTVTDATSSAPLSGQPVVVYDDLGVPSFAVYTATDGTYETAGLESGTYYVRTETSDYQDVLYDGTVCDPDCDETTGTPVQVSLATETAGVDFALTALGVISGTVLESGSGTPVVGEQVVAIDAAGISAGFASTSSDGSYEIRRLRAGTYRVRTYTGTHQNEVWNDIVCEPDCNVAMGDPVVVSLATTTSWIDFSLARRGRISGTVTNTLAEPFPLPVAVEFHYSDGELAGTTTATADGSYVSPYLPAGEYFVNVGDASGLYVRELYDDIRCVYCDLTTGTPVAVVSGGTTWGIDFTLDRLGEIQGVVTAADTGLGLQAFVQAVSGSGAVIKASFASPGAVFRIRSLEPGIYYVRTSLDGLPAGEIYQDELYDNIACEPLCDISNGVEISIALNSTVAGVDFSLAPCPADSYADVTAAVYTSTTAVEACERLTAGNNTTVATGADVTFKAGRRIVLTDGFAIESGASFRAVIEPAWSPD